LNRAVCFNRLGEIRDRSFENQRHRAEEGVIGKLIVEAVILLSASKQADGSKVLRTAAQAYKVDTDAIALKVKHEFAAKEKARTETKKTPPVAIPKKKQAA
jgi:ParB family transcriptional regulator, chromosome partitioning protein